MASSWKDNKREYEAMYRHEYSFHETIGSHTWITLCVIAIFTAFCMSVFDVSVPGSFARFLSGSSFIDGLASGTIIGLLIYARRRREEKRLQEEAQDKTEQAREEEFGYHNYRSSGA